MRHGDVVLSLQDETFECHRVILAAVSPYFRALFQHNRDTGVTSDTVRLEMSPTGFGLLLQFMYTHELKIDLENILDVLDAADFLQFRPIVEKCCSVLLQHINSHNCLTLHQIAEGHLCKGLAEATRSFILRNFEDVCRTEEFLRLDKDTLAEFVGDERLQVESEASLLKSVCNWICFDFESRKKDIWELIQKVRVFAIDKYELRTILCNDKRLEKITTDIVKEHDRNDDGSLTPAASGKSGRPKEVLVVVPRDTSASDGQRKTDIWYHCRKEEKWKSLTQTPFINRMNHDVAVLNNEIYLTGGVEYNLTLDQVMVFSVKDKHWSEFPAMRMCRSDHSSAALAGKLYVVGGVNQFKTKWNTASAVRNDAEVFDPESEQWTLLPGEIRLSSVGKVAVVPLDRRLFVIGGTATAKPNASPQGRTGVVCFDVDKNVWCNIPTNKSLEDMNMTVSIGDCLQFEGCILLIDEDLRGKRMAVFNPVTGLLHWFIHTHGSHRFGGYAIQGNKLFLTGGVAAVFKTHDMVHYQDLGDPEGTWKHFSPLPKPYSHHACVLVSKFED